MFTNIDLVGKRYRFNTNLPIVGDEEGLNLTSYQSASEHTANRIFDKLGVVSVLELCSGVGGTTVFLAKNLKYVYAVDVNPIRIKASKINAKTFGVLDRVNFIDGNVLDEELLKYLGNKDIAAVVTDVEWRDNLANSLADTTSNIFETIPSTPILFEKVNRLISQNIVMHMAANINKEQLMKLADCEIEEMIYHGDVKFINVYFGKLINIVGVTSFRMD